MGMLLDPWFALDMVQGIGKNNGIQGIVRANSRGILPLAPLAVGEGHEVPVRASSPLSFPLSLLTLS